MNEKLRFFMTLGILVVVIFGFFFVSKTITEVTGYSIAGWIIKGLHEEGQDCTDIMTLYMRPGCGYCTQQKEILGDKINNVNVVDCSIDMDACKEIRGVPTWIINEEEHLGVRTIEQLNELSGCEL